MSKISLLIIQLTKYIYDNLKQNKDSKFIYSTYIYRNVKYFEVTIKEIKLDNWKKANVIILYDNI